MNYLRIVALAMLGALPVSRAGGPPSASTAVNAPASMAVIMGETSAGYVTRLTALRALGRDLSPNEIQALYVLMDRKSGADPAPPGDLNALKNDAANVLRNQRNWPPNLPRKLMTMYADPGHDAVWRDYCIQHLGGCLNRLVSFKPTENNEVTAAKDTLWAATGDKTGGIGGTALIALVTSVGTTGIERDRLADRTYTLAADEATGELTRITALQICARMGERRILPVARSLAAKASSVPLRISAIAAVGTLGGTTDRAMLEDFSHSSDARLRTAARSALKRLPVN